MKLSALIVIILTASPAIAVHWEFEQVDSVSICDYVQIIRHDSIIWLAYATPDTLARLARFDGSWVFEDIDRDVIQPCRPLPGVDNPFSFAVAPNGMPAVAVENRLAEYRSPGWSIDSAPIEAISSGLGYDPRGRPGLIVITPEWETWLVVRSDSGWSSVRANRGELSGIAWGWAGRPVWRSDGAAAIDDSYWRDGMISWGTWIVLVQEGDSWRYVRGGGGRSSWGAANAVLVDRNDDIHVYWAEDGAHVTPKLAYNDDSLAYPAGGNAILDLHDRPQLVWGANWVWYAYRDGVWHIESIPGTAGSRRCDIAVTETGQPIVAFVAADNSIWLARGTGVTGTAEHAQPARPTALRIAAIVRGSLNLPASPITHHSSLITSDGRKVMELQPGKNDVRHLAPGVYFIRSGPSDVSGQPRTDQVRKVVIQR